MTWTGILSWLAFLGVIAGLLFLSLIHLFMIPKDVMKRDTERQRELEGDYEEELRRQEATLKPSSTPAPPAE